MTQPTPEPHNGANALAWLVVLVILGFIFGIIKVTTTYTPISPASQTCVSTGGTIPGC